jgi:Dolichyl-phosphate-mannose-protein mannosyltransferase
VDQRLRNVILAAVLFAALGVRLDGIHTPLLDHPGWRQGDTAAIARNFATLDYNLLHPQTDYDGPPPNYAELELQIVPILAATLYNLFGIHEIFGRLISIAFSLGTVAVLAALGRRLRREGGAPPQFAGLTAAFLFAAYPGSTYYGRTFMPDTTMIFFFSAAVYASVLWIVDHKGFWGRSFWAAASLTALALAAKPVAVVALAPICAVMCAQWGMPGLLKRPQAYAFFALALAPLAAYDHYVSSIAEWHWASGITRLHVLPSLIAAFQSWDALHLKLRIYREVLAMLPGTMLGPWCTALFALAVVFTPLRSTARTLLPAWLVASLAYAFVVMTVERVDYYFYIILPLAALWSGMLIERAAATATRKGVPVAITFAAAMLAAAAFVIVNRGPVRAYYRYNPAVYRAAKALDATLEPHTLVVMGHYDPSILYYINRKGWEEDPYMWTPFDEQSAIRKGARYYIDVEHGRLKRNVELYAWLQRFPIMNPYAKWPVYQTQYAKVLPGAEKRWQAFRKREKENAP